MLLIVLGLLFTLFLYWLVIKPQNHWPQKGAKQIFSIPFFSDFWSFIIGRTVVENVMIIYDAFPEARYTGFFNFSCPSLLIKDPELLKLICVKDFDHFVDHRSFIPEDVDPLWSRNLVSLTGEKWRDMRATLSPSFTSSKMKAMFVLMTQTAKRFVNHFLEKNENIIDVEFKDIYTRFANDVIANTVFGIECDSLKEPNNDFYVMTKRATNFNGIWRMMQIIIVVFIPKLGRLLKLSWFHKDVGNFFRKVVVDNMEYRTKHNIVRPDVINLLMEARSGKSNYVKHEEMVEDDANFAAVKEHLESKEFNGKHLTDDEITSQALIFIFAGFETVSTAMSFLCYELAVNPDIQNKLIKEIDENHILNKDLTYETLNKMIYLDMVLTESLRKWPPAAMTDRACTKSYTIQPVTPEEKPVYLKPKDSLVISPWTFHHDPKYYTNPEHFDPERFSPENRKNINPYTYLPFGIGPRNCIGSRFALLEIKAAIYYILLNFEIVPTAKSTIPVKLAKRNMNVLPEDGFHFGFKRRN